MFAQPAALLFFVTKTLRNGEPLEWFAEFPFMSGHDPGQAWSQLRAQRHFALAFVGEIEELADDFGAAFFCVKLGRLQERGVPFDEAVAAANISPTGKDRISKRAIVR